MGHEDHVRGPFGGPGGFFHEEVVGIARDLAVGIGVVVAELVEVGIGLVGDALAVAIDVDAGEGGGFDGVFGEVPDAVEEGVGGFKVCGVVFPGGEEGGAALDVFGFERAGPAFDFDPTERKDDAPFLGGEDGGGVGGVALVRCGGDGGGLEGGGVGLGGGVADGAGRFAVDAAVLGEFFAEVDGDVSGGAGVGGEGDVGEGDFAEVDEVVAGGDLFDFDGSLGDEADGRGLGVDAC